MQVTHIAAATALFSIDPQLTGAAEIKYSKLVK